MLKSESTYIVKPINVCFNDKTTCLNGSKTKKLDEILDANNNYCLFLDNVKILEVLKFGSDH